MEWVITKYFITAAVVLFASEVAKRSDKLGGFFAAIPLVNILTLIWLYIDKQSKQKMQITRGIHFCTCCQRYPCFSFSRRYCQS